MERAAGFGHDDTAQAKLDKIDALLAQALTPRQDAALLAEMLSLRYEDDAAVKPSYLMRLEWAARSIGFIRDYKYVRYAIDAAELVLARWQSQ
jgi:hypothetical protein